ncbi:winged helix-turn-helix domain-containing protein, partial [Marilutibacter aestuarii]
MVPEGLAPEGPGPPARYRFDDIRVDTVAHTLTRGGVPCALEPKAFAVLTMLLQHAGELVGKDELLDAVWGHRHVTPGVLTRAIAQLRAALGDDAHQPRYIHTHHALGYRFIGELQVDGEAEASVPVVPTVAVAEATAEAEGA